MPLKTPGEYVESLRDGRGLYWDGDGIDDVAKDAASACRSRSPRGTTSTTTRSGAS